MKPFALFDLDGTLVASMHIWAGTMLKYLDEKGVAYPADTIRIITPLGYRGSARFFINELGLQEDEDTAVENIIRRAEYAYAHEIKAKPGVAAFLERLRAAGVSCNVLTASPHRTTDPCLKANGIYSLFDHVWSIEDFGMVKDNPAIYHAAAERLGCAAADICFFDDNLLALTAGKAAGMETVGIYDDSSAGDQEKIRAVADRYVMSFEEL